MGQERLTDAMLSVSSQRLNALRTLRGLMWHSNPNCGNIRETKKEKQRPFCGKALMPHCDLWCTHRAKDCALVNTKGEKTCLPGGREAGS